MHLAEWHKNNKHSILLSVVLPNHSKLTILESLPTSKRNLLVSDSFSKLACFKGIKICGGLAYKKVRRFNIKSVYKIGSRKIMFEWVVPINYYTVVINSVV